MTRPGLPLPTTTEVAACGYDDDAHHDREDGREAGRETRPVKINERELLNKGAIEVSRSRFNYPIFLVPKPHGHGMRAVLDFREVNVASIPDRYTIREVRDCVDKIGLARSSVFSTIDLTSGFWQQSLNPTSRPYTSFTVPGKGTRYSGPLLPCVYKGVLQVLPV